MKENTQQFDTSIKRLSTRTYAIWFVSVSFALFQFFLQLSSGVILSTIMTEMNLNAWLVGLLGSSFYYVYTIMQIPAGMFFDYYNPRILITVSASVCALGCIFFAAGNTFNTLLLSRLLIGAGSSFAFIGLSHILRFCFPLKLFALLLGLSETLAFIITALGIANLSQIIHLWGWRMLMIDAGFIGLVISLSAWLIIPKNMNTSSTSVVPKQGHLVRLFSNPYLWLNGVYVFLGFITITVFGAMWAVPFIQMKLQCSLHQAAQIDAWLFLGAALSCPLAGFLSAQLKTHQPITVSSAFFTALLIWFTLYTNIQYIVIYNVLMFLIGFFCGGYMLAFSICNDLVNLQQRTTATGFTNTMAMLSAPLLIPLVGYVSDHVTSRGYSALTAYQAGLSLIPVCLMIAGILALFLPNRHHSAKSVIIKA